jgi:hypothetical protein
MYIYNVTVNVEKEIISEWIVWMKEVHIPEVLETGMFVSCQLNKVMVEEEQGETFAVQYTAKELENIRLYQEMYAPALQKETLNKFGQKCVAFRTILEVMEQF